MNLVVISGRLTADPELRYTGTEVPVCTFTLAVDRPGRSEEADFPVVTAWRETAEFVKKYLGKGRKIMVKGQLRTHLYEDVAGNKRKGTEIMAERVEFADSRPTAALGTDETDGYPLPWETDNE